MSRRPLPLAAALLVLGCLWAQPAAAAKLLTARDGLQKDGFGGAVAIEGDTAAVGAPGRNDGTGAVFVFERTRRGWRREAKLTASNGGPTDRFGESIAIDGETIVVGAGHADFDFGGQGMVYTFARTGRANRTETARLGLADPNADDRLGATVAIEGDTILATADGYNEGYDANQGAVFAFSRNGPFTRTEVAKLVASDGAHNDNLGSSLAVDGDVVVVGADGDNIGESDDQGSVYTFKRPTRGTRHETAKLKASDGDADDRLGSSVAIEGGKIAAGAKWDERGEKRYQGAIYTFSRIGRRGWGETAKLTTRRDHGPGELGFAVAIGRDYIVGTAPFQDVAYVFRRRGRGARTEIARLPSSPRDRSDFFGASVAFGPEEVIIGSPSDDVGATEDQGSARVFSGW